MKRGFRSPKKKSGPPIRNIVKYEFDGSPHYGAIQKAYARCARTDDSRDCEKLSCFALPPISRKVSSVESYRQRRQGRRQVHGADKASSEANPCSARRGYLCRAGFLGSLSRKQAKR